MADNQGLKPIYIEQLFRSKNPGVAKMIPGFIYSYLKKVIHQTISMILLPVTVTGKGWTSPMRYWNISMFPIR